MSAEAIRYVIEHSDTRGTYRVIMLAMAIRCRKKKIPYVLSVPCRELARDVNIGHKWLLDALNTLEDRQELEKLVSGSGRRPSTYEIRCRVVAGTARQEAIIRYHIRQRKTKTDPLGIPDPHTSVMLKESLDMGSPSDVPF